jgi:hypothetical protein
MCIDVTLAHFLMTLESPAQTREYIGIYLGNAPGVNEFATGFLRHKEFDSGAAKVSGSKAATATTATLPSSSVATASTGGGFGALIGGVPAKTETAKKAAPKAKAAKGGKK